MISILTLAAFAAVFIYQNTALMQLTCTWSVSMATTLIFLASNYSFYCRTFSFVSELSKKRLKSESWYL